MYVLVSCLSIFGANSYCSATDFVYRKRLMKKTNQYRKFLHDAYIFFLNASFNKTELYYFVLQSILYTNIDELIAIHNI